MLYSYKNSATSRVRQASGRSKGSAAVTAHQPATSTSEGIVVKIKPPATEEKKATASQSSAMRI